MEKKSKRIEKGSPLHSIITVLLNLIISSDDACQYHYLVPANMFASATLKYIQEIAVVVWKDNKIIENAKRLKDQIDEGIKVEIKRKKLEKKKGKEGSERITIYWKRMEKKLQRRIDQILGCPEYLRFL